MVLPCSVDNAGHVRICYLLTETYNAILPFDIVIMTYEYRVIAYIIFHQVLAYFSPYNVHLNYHSMLYRISMSLITQIVFFRISMMILYRTIINF